MEAAPAPAPAPGPVPTPLRDFAPSTTAPPPTAVNTSLAAPTSTSPVYTSLAAPTPASMPAPAPLVVPPPSLNLDLEIARWAAKAERDEVRAREAYREMTISRRQLALLRQLKEDEERSKLNCIIPNFHSFLVELHFVFSAESILSIIENAPTAFMRPP